MMVDEASALLDPLLGPLMGRAPARLGASSRSMVRHEGKRVRWRLAQILSRSPGPRTAGQLCAEAGFGAKEVGAALVKMVRAGDVRVIDAFLGKRKGYQWTRSA